MLKEVLNSAEHSGALDRAKESRNVNVDTMVQEKNISFLTNAKLYHNIL